MSPAESTRDLVNLRDTPRLSHRGRSVGVAGVLAGLMVVVAGTFAPWVISGGVDRDSYAIAGIAGRLGLAGDGFGATALGWWPFVGPIAMGSLIAAILRWWRTSAWIAIVFGVSTGVIGGGVSAVAGGHAAVGITLAPAGPTVTVIGAALAVIGGTAVLIAERRGSAEQIVAPPEFVPAPAEPFGGPTRQSAQRVPDRPHRMAQ